MCKFYIRNFKLLELESEKQEEDVSKVLLAVSDLKRKARIDYATIEEGFDQLSEMQTVLSKLIVTHIDSDNYANHLFKRAEQLSSHLETYKKIVGKIDIGLDIHHRFHTVSDKFIDYLRERIEFKATWIEGMQTIEEGKKTVDSKLIILNEMSPLAHQLFEADDYFELRDLRTRFDTEFAALNDLVECCFQCGKRCKELGNHLYNRLAELESCFQSVVKCSMSRINEMKRTPAELSTEDSDDLS